MKGPQSGCLYDLRWPVWISLALAVVTFLAFDETLHFGFLEYDDPVYVNANARVLSGLRRDNLMWALTATEAGFWHPLTWISLMTDHELYGLNAGGYHLTNLLLHISTTVLLFLMLFKISGFMWRSAVVAVLFALHPLHVESVAWIAERKDVLSGFFWMATLAVYAGYAKRPGWLRYGFVLICFALALMSKPMVVTLPAVLLLLDLWPLGRFSSGIVGREGQVPLKKLLLEKVPLGLMAIGTGWITFVAEHRLGALPSWEAFPFVSRLSNAIVSYTLYIKKMIWPFDLAVFYPHPGGWPFWQVLGALLILSGITYAVIRWFRSRPYLFVGWFWYLVTLLPVIGFIQIGAHAMADRYSYIPSIGLIIIAVWGGSECLSAFCFRKRLISHIFLASIVFCLFVLTNVQVRTWRSTLALFEHAVSVTENNGFAHHNYGYALMEAGRLAEAKQQFEQALSLRPDYDAFYNSLGVALMRMKRYEEAILPLEHALQLNPRYRDARYNLGMAYAAIGNRKQAATHFAYGLKDEPQNIKLLMALGMVLTNDNELNAAMVLYRKVSDIDPCHAGAYHNIGMICLRQGRTDDAIRYFSQALSCEQRFASAHYHLAEALKRKGMDEEARRHSAEALRINPRMKTFDAKDGF